MNYSYSPMLNLSLTEKGVFVEGYLRAHCSFISLYNTKEKGCSRLGLMGIFMEVGLLHWVTGKRTWTGKQTEQLWCTYCLVATVLDNFTYWEGKDGMGKENAQKIFSSLLFCVFVFFYVFLGFF